MRRHGANRLPPPYRQRGELALGNIVERTTECLCGMQQFERSLKARPDVIFLVDQLAHDVA